MAENRYIEQRMRAILDAMMPVHRACNIPDFPDAVRGPEREIYVQQFWSEVFPHHLRITRGAITDSYGKISGEIDIAVEPGFYPTIPFPNLAGSLMSA